MAELLMLRRALAKLVRTLGVSAVILIAIGAALALWGPGEDVAMGAHPLLSAVVGVLGGWFMMGFTYFTSAKMAKKVQVGLGWIGLDYLVKILVTLTLVLTAKTVGLLSPLIVGVLLVSAIALTALAQVVAFRPVEKKP